MNTDNLHRPRPIHQVSKQERKSYLDTIVQQNAEKAKQARIGDPSDLGSTVSTSDNYNGRPKNNNPKYEPQILMTSRTAKRIEDNAILRNLKASQKENTDDFCRPTTIVSVPKKARQSSLDAFRQHNAEEAEQNRVVGPGDLGCTVSIPGNYNGQPKNSGCPKYYPEKLMPKRTDKDITNNEKQDNCIFNRKENTDGFHTPTTIVPVPRQTRKNNNNIDVFGHRDPEQANQNRIGDPIDFAFTAFIPDKCNGRPKNNGQRYDLDLLMRTRVISSDDVRKSTLIKRDETAKEFSGEKTDEDDETFFAILKKRIIEDLHKNISKSARDTPPQRSLKPRKVKSLFDNETRRLMNKFREEFAVNQSKKILSKEHGMFSMERRSSSCTREDISEQPHSATPQNVVECRMAKNNSKKHFETNDDSLRERSPFNEIHAEAYNDQSTSSTSERSRMFSMKRRSNSWKREDFREDRNPRMSQNVMECRMTKNISKKHFETDEESIHERPPFNHINAEAHNDQLIPASERNRVVSLKRQCNSWIHENTREHTHPTMSQKVVESRMTENMSAKNFETDEDSLRDRSPFDRIDAAEYNDQPTPSPSERIRMFSMKRRSNSWAQEDICEPAQSLMPQNVVEPRAMNDVMWGSCEIHPEDYYCPSIPSLWERNDVFSLEGRNNGSNRESICPDLQPAIPQYVVEHRMTNDMSMKSPQTNGDSLHDRASFNEVHPEAYNRQPLLLSSGYSLGDYPAIQYYQIMQ